MKQSSIAKIKSIASGKQSLSVLIQFHIDSDHSEKLLRDAVGQRLQGYTRIDNILKVSGKVFTFLLAFTAMSERLNYNSVYSYVY